MCSIAAFLLLVMMLFLPPGSDIYIFSTGGKMILEGKIPYKDFIDSKSPGIFYLYAGIHAAFGYALEAVRIFDLLYHIVSLAFFYLLLKRYLNDTRIASLSVLIYALWYVSSGIWSTAQSESFALLPTLAIIWSVQKSLDTTSQKNIPLYALAAGIATILLISLKFTLLYPVVIAIGIVWWYHSSKKAGLLYSVVIGLLVTSSAIFFYWWLGDTGAKENFVLMMDWLGGYSSLNPFNDLRTYTIIFFEGFPQRLLTYYSPTFIVLGVIGIYLFFGKNDLDKKDTLVSSIFSTHLLLQLAVGILTILFERKNIPHHFSRSFWAFTPFIAVGMIALWDTVYRSWAKLKDSDIFTRLSKRTIYLAIVALLLLATPIIKTYSEAFSFMLLDVTGYKSESIDFYDYIGAESQLDKLQLYLSENMNPGDSFFVWGLITGLHSRMNIPPPTIMLSNIQLRSAWTSDTLKNLVLQQLQVSPPTYIIIESGDYHTNLIGTLYDSYGAYLVWEEFLSFVDDNYIREYEMPTFTLFKRI